jgi:hypothetical protein
VYNRIPRDAYFALADEAKQQHIDFAGHVPDAITAQEVSAAGQRSIKHLKGIALACSSKQETLMAALYRAEFFREHLAIEADGYRTLDQAKCKALFAEFRQNDTWQVPTLTVRRMVGRLDDSKLTSDPRLVYIDRKSRERWQNRIDRNSSAGTLPNISSRAVSFQSMNASWARCFAQKCSSWREPMR